MTHSCVCREVLVVVLCGDMTHSYVSWIASSYSMRGHDSFVCGMMCSGCTTWDMTCSYVI